MLTIYVDADACPVKEEIYRVAGRHELPVLVVAKTLMRVPATARVELVVCAGFGAAWLFEKTGSWTKVFWAMIACDLIAAFLALFWLKPVAARTVEKSISGLQPVDMTAPTKARGVA